MQEQPRICISQNLGNELIRKEQLESFYKQTSLTLYLYYFIPGGEGK